MPRRMKQERNHTNISVTDWPFVKLNLLFRNHHGITEPAPAAGELKNVNLGILTY